MHYYDITILWGQLYKDLTKEQRQRFILFGIECKIVRFQYFLLEVVRGYLGTTQDTNGIYDYCARHPLPAIVQTEPERVTRVCLYEVALRLLQIGKAIVTNNIPEGRIERHLIWHLREKQLGITKEPCYFCGHRGCAFCEWVRV